VAWKVKELSKEKARLRSQLERAGEQGNQEKASLLDWEYNKQAWELVLSKVGGVKIFPTSPGASTLFFEISQSKEPSQTLNQ
jgi:hypothetical protein